MKTKKQILAQIKKLDILLKSAYDGTAREDEIAVWGLEGMIKMLKWVLKK